MWEKVKAGAKYIAKAVVALAVPILWEAGIEIVQAAQNTWADSPLVSAALGALAVYLVRNGPKPS